MNALHILFRTSRFNLSKVGEHFINPCCFGEDFALWLRERLIERRIEVRQAYQEDWGWELPVMQGSDSYHLCMSGNSDESSANMDEGEWRIIVEKARSIGQRLRGTGENCRNGRNGEDDRRDSPRGAYGLRSAPRGINKHAQSAINRNSRMPGKPATLD